MSEHRSNNIARAWLAPVWLALLCYGTMLALAAIKDRLGWDWYSLAVWAVGALAMLGISLIASSPFVLLFLLRRRLGLAIGAWALATILLSAALMLNAG